MAKKAASNSPAARHTSRLQRNLQTLWNTMTEQSYGLTKSDPDTLNTQIETVEETARILGLTLEPYNGPHRKQLALLTKDEDEVTDADGRYTGPEDTDWDEEEDEDNDT
jgi:hypothetical protein